MKVISYYKRIKNLVDIGRECFNKGNHSLDKNKELLYACYSAALSLQNIENFSDKELETITNYIYRIYLYKTYNIDYRNIYIN